MVLTKKIILIPRNLKKIIVILLDINLCFLSILISFYLRIGDLTIFNYLILIKLITSFALCVLIILPIFKIYGIYNSIFRFSGIFDAKLIVKALLIYGIVFSLLIAGIGLLSIPRTIGIIQPIILAILIITSRFIANKILTFAPLLDNNKNKKNVFIYGANEKGKLIENVLLSNNQMKVIGYFDDDKQMHGHILNGIKIFLFIFLLLRLRKNLF